MTHYAYDGSQIVFAMDESGSITNRYLWGPLVDQILADEQVGDDVYWPAADHLGTVRDILDSSGDVANHINYDSFGNIVSEANAAVDHLFGYTGRPFDAASGLQNNMNRWYDPTTGRWTTEDPISFAGDDANLYRYVGNTVTTYTDPTGYVRLFGQEFVAPWTERASWGIRDYLRAYGNATVVAVAGTSTGAVTGGAIGAGVGAGVGVFAGGAGAVPGAIAGGTLGGIGGAISGFFGAMFSDNAYEAMQRGAVGGVGSGLSGGLAGPAVGTGTTVVIGSSAFGSAVESGTTTWLDGGNSTDILRDSLEGGLIGGVTAGVLDGSLRQLAKCRPAKGAAPTSPHTNPSSTNRLETSVDEAVFWSGIGRGGDKKAAEWVVENGGSSLETTLASRNIKLPKWDPNDSSVVSAWRNASLDFANGAKGDIRVLQGGTLRIDAIFGAEFKSLIANQNVKSITSIIVETGVEVLLWSR